MGEPVPGTLAAVERHGAVRDEDVRALVRTLLEHQDFEGRRELLDQVQDLEYVGGPVTFMQLRVDRRRTPAKAESPVPNRATVLDDAGEPLGGLLLWLDAQGYIDSLEYYWFEGDPPTRLPEPHQIFHD